MKLRSIVHQCSSGLNFEDSYLICFSIFPGMVGSLLVAMGAAVCKAGACYSILCTFACCMGVGIDPVWVYCRPGGEDKLGISN